MPRKTLRAATLTHAAHGVCIAGLRTPMPRKVRADLPRECQCRETHHCKRPTAYAAFDYICWPCRNGTHDLTRRLDSILAKGVDRKIRRKASAAKRRQEGVV